MPKRREYTVLAAEKETFAMWLATPENLRRPATKKEFAELVNVSQNTIRQWSTDYRVLKRQSELMDDRIITGWPAVLDAVQTTAMDPTNPRQIQAAKLLMDWHEAVQVDDELEIEALSNEQLQKMALKIYDAASDNQATG